MASRAAEDDPELRRFLYQAHQEDLRHLASVTEQVDRAVAWVIRCELEAARPAAPKWKVRRAERARRSHQRALQRLERNREYVASGAWGRSSLLRFRRLRKDGIDPFSVFGAHYGGLRLTVIDGGLG